ncbi:hypothetical protein H8788_03970 [Parabacteroides faecis]|uniref:hypothetical protein n=1 Tax=Parabacteroides TaxID=375288 RepID=UPI000F00C889|nr:MULTISPECIES: hypothetical protein [Parabacteroides]MBC8616886.1 hypothetical protein [Parabacteroides faecis]RHR94426.1 hypothetical protein DWW23_19690 [Parabacteroides sp. AF14-59]
MRTIYKKITFLLLVVLACACNKDEDTTIVLEDGQPKAATLIVGKWKPSKKQLIDKLTGKVIKDEPLDEEESSFWEFFEDGTFGKAGSTGDRFNWNVDEDDYTVSFEDKKWSIGALTKAKMILYLLGKKGNEEEDKNNLLAYFFDRFGEYEEEDDNTEEPASGSKIAKITATTTYLHSSNKRVETYTFTYDKKGRIDEYLVGASQAPFIYSYEKDMVSVDGPESYRGLLNNKDHIETLQYLDADKKTAATASYNGLGYLITINNTSLKYDKENNLSAVGYFEYKYTKEKNDSNLDLNCLISNCSTAYEYDYSHYSLFAPFGFYGKFSTNMIVEEHGYNWDYYSVYNYERDKESRIIKIVRKAINNFNHDETLNTTTFDIIYQD